MCRAMDPRIDGEQAFEVLNTGIGRRDLLRAAALVSAGATMPRWLASPGVAEAAAPAGGEPSTLQPAKGRTDGLEGGSVAAPTFKRIAQGILQELRVPADRPGELTGSSH